MIRLEKFTSLRLIATLSVLAVHFLVIFLSEGPEPQTNRPISSDFFAYIGLFNITKFGNVFFFIVSGFFFQKKSVEYQSNFRKFLNKKYYDLLKPFLLIAITPLLIFHFVLPFFSGWANFSLSDKLHRTFMHIMFSPYWFIPTLFLYFVINFFIRNRHLSGSLLISAIITLAFSLNCYWEKIPVVHHSATGIGFLFFFILGRYMFLHQRLPFFDKLKTSVLLALLIFFFAASQAESCLIYRYHIYQDYLNSLRLSNLLFSLTLFEYISRRRFEEKIPRQLKNANTYFIYLIHVHFLSVLQHTPIAEWTAKLGVMAIPLAIAGTFILSVPVFFLEKMSRRLLFNNILIQYYFFKKPKIQVASLEKAPATRNKNNIKTAPRKKTSAEV